jgi:hypothetical protein
MPARVQLRVLQGIQLKVRRNSLALPARSGIAARAVRLAGRLVLSAAFQRVSREAICA